MKVDFTKFRIFESIDHSSEKEMDIHKEFSDIIYKNGHGIASHDLAMKIYHTEGEVEISEEEVSIIMDLVQNTTPIFIDSMKFNLYGKAD